MKFLSRYGPENYCRPPEGSRPDVNALDELFLMGLTQMTHGAPAFLNCTRDFLLHDYLQLLPEQTIVAEILESVDADTEVLAACRRMKKLGYRFALDDYDDRAALEPFFELTNYVKIDFLSTRFEEQRRLADKFHHLGIPLIAEKVETHEQFDRGRAMGYQYFQGYFFCRPEIVSRNEVRPNKAIYLRLLSAATQAELDLPNVGDLIEQELSLSY